MITIIYLLIAFLLPIAALFWAVCSLASIFYGAPTISSGEKIAEEALALAGLKKSEVFLDLGCGFGKTLAVAEKKFGAKAIGVDISPVCWLWNKINSRQIVFANLKKIDIKKFNADVIYFYLFPEIVEKLTPLLLSELKKGKRLISLSFPMKNVLPKKEIKVGGKRVFLYK